jgi:hypothetical protein
VSRLVVRHGVFHRNSLRGGLGEDAPSVAVPVTDLTELRTRTDRIIEKLEEQNRARKWTLMIGGASALFAAVKLGLVTFGAIKSRSGS